MEESLDIPHQEAHVIFLLVETSPVIPKRVSGVNLERSLFMSPKVLLMHALGITGPILHSSPNQDVVIIIEAIVVLERLWPGNGSSRNIDAPKIHIGSSRSAHLRPTLLCCGYQRLGAGKKKWKPGRVIAELSTLSTRPCYCVEVNVCKCWSVQRSKW
ncbi:putative proteasome-associated protein ECM29-like protein [Sesbania bispinosa]|nr:putative proteasome-associated protein ECM29-like protein [Sesbania bispinosa]